MEKPYLLVIDDNENFINICTSFFCANGFDIDAAAEGKLGVKMYFENPQKYDAVLLDFHMPFMDGNQVAEFIRKNEADSLRHLPIIAMSGDRGSVQNNYFDSFIYKPFQLSDLLLAVRNVLQDWETL